MQSGRCTNCGQPTPAPKTCPTCGQEAKKVKGGWGDCILWKNPRYDRVATLGVYTLLGSVPKYRKPKALVWIHSSGGTKLLELECALDELPVTIREAQRWAEEHFGVDVS